ncbi:ParA family protein [Leptospira adleri]|uniref:Chromosome partitioning protein ParA n=1 Tax=Leptospira adleri TaxID=2023186 RepID=A0A2M9YIX3_9LEPT|nr:ParA family protein [Leptospira adleri]PJZ51487.1 chromosome partitioning protein ParA [Leptospira adleri]PJZ61605.1 chromosome partitioning protein ParA [Leptospira adleri]
MKVYTFANVKGGVSKSTSASHLSMALARRGKTLGVDHDPQADMSDVFFPDESPEFFDQANTFTVIRSESTLKEAIKSKYGVDLLLSALELEDFQYYVGKDVSLVTRLNEVLRKSEYDFVVIDTPGSGSSEMLSALLATDAVIIPVNPSKWAVRTIKKVFRKINEACNFPGSHLTSVSILPTIWGKSGRSEQIFDQLQQIPQLLKFLQSTEIGFEKVPVPIILPPIPQSSTIRDRTEFGEPLKEGTEGWLAYDLLADLIIEKTGAVITNK